MDVKTISQFSMDRLINMWEDKAVKLIEKNGLIPRIVMVDGQPKVRYRYPRLPSPSRINLEIKNGRVVWSYAG